jgi:hypothetical protein
LEPKKKISLRLKSCKYQLIYGLLFRKNYDNVFLICLEKPNVDNVLVQLHDGLDRGHFGGEAFEKQIPRAGYIWPTLFKYAYSYARKCKICHTSLGRENKPAFPL